jgi:hypothetical protein
MLRSMVRRLKRRSQLFALAVEHLRRVQHFVGRRSIGYGLVVNHFTGRTPKASHEALVAAFIKSGGRTNDVLARLISLYKRPYRIKDDSGLLEPLASDALAEIQVKLETGGRHVFSQRLPDAFCDKIAERIADAGFVVRDDDLPYDPSKLHKYDRSAPFAHNYMLPPDDITDIPEVQELLSDPTLIRVAQNYLRLKAIFTGLGLYWSAAVKDRPNGGAPAGLRPRPS